MLDYEMFQNMIDALSYLHEIGKFLNFKTYLVVLETGIMDL